MNKIFGVVVLGLFLMSFVSASVAFSAQPNTIYNFGDNVNATIDIVPTPTFNGIVSAYLACGGTSSEVYKEFLSLNEETPKTIIIPLVKELIGNSSGNCVINVYSDKNLLTTSNEFGISKKVNVELTNLNGYFNPGDLVNMTGLAVKEDGQRFTGLYKINVNGSFVSGVVTNGTFLAPFQVPNNFPAGEYPVNVSVYEKDSSGSIINSGNKIYFLRINQIPTSVEIILNNNTILPGENLSGRVILHDQTGVGIPGIETYVAVKDSSGNIISKITTNTNKTFNYYINTSQEPAYFVVSAYSDGIVNSVNFVVPKYEKVKSELTNNTLTITNIGNVYYNGTIHVEIGESNVSVPVSLAIGGHQDYVISAPDGSYNVSVGGVKRTLSLSGNAVEVQKLGGTGTGLSPIVWIVLILILLMGVYLAFRREHKKRSVARINTLKTVQINPSKKKQLKRDEAPVANNVKDGNLNISRKAELLLSISGSKQNAVMGCISLKNYPEISSGEGNVNETLSSISEVVEGNKGFVYSTGNYIFFVFAPGITKTFRNEDLSIKVSQKIKDILDNHNRKFRKKIVYGISLNYGGIIT